MIERTKQSVEALYAGLLLDALAVLPENSTVGVLQLSQRLTLESSESSVALQNVIAQGNEPSMPALETAIKETAEVEGAAEKCLGWLKCKASQKCARKHEGARVITVHQFVGILVVVFGIPVCVAGVNFAKRSGARGVGVEARSQSQPTSASATPAPSPVPPSSHPSVATEYDYSMFDLNFTHEMLQRVARGETI